MRCENSARDGFLLYNLPAKTPELKEGSSGGGKEGVNGFKKKQATAALALRRTGRTDISLLPLITGEARAHHGEILRQAAALAEAGSLKPLLSNERFSPSRLEAAFALVESGSFR